MAAARKALPGTPAAWWDPDWAGELCGDALARLSERFAEIPAHRFPDIDFAGRGPWAERMHAAALANDPAAFRAALDGWERAAIEALEASTSEASGAA